MGQQPTPPGRPGLMFAPTRRVELPAVPWLTPTDLARASGVR